jgi:two-component system, OmpR family, phosphate regulon sensor histidine kinase PhoR
MKSRNTLTIALMLTSIILLLALQVLWLRSEYQNSIESFRKEANTIFRNTVMAMQDTLIEKSIKPMKGDSIFTRSIYKSKLKSDSVFIFTTRDSIPHGAIRERSSNIQLFVNSSVKSDSISHLVRPLLSRIEADEPGQSFVIRLTSDTLELKEIKKNFSRALLDAGLVVTATVSRLNREERIRMNDSIISTFPVRVHPGQGYIASFSSIDSFVWTKLAPQALFSIFLTLLTIASFFVMYRSLRTHQRLMELKNDFISNVTHELKTPVSTVSVALEALKNFHGLDNPERTKEYLDIAQNELKRLTLMTDKILKASVFENNGVVIQKEAVDIQKITQQILDSMKLLFDKNKAQVSFHAEGSNFVVEGESAHVTNVIYNFLDNALKYSPEQPQINIKLKETSNQLILSIQDNGIGIAPEYKKKIFEKFFRVPTGDVHNIKGYGLGLSYVASVMKAHGGMVDVVSEPGKGSNFIATFPKGLS